MTPKPTCSPTPASHPAPHEITLNQSLERLNKEVKRRADVVGIFPNEDSIIRLVGAVLLEQNDEWQLQHRYMQIEGFTELAQPMIEEENQPPHHRQSCMTMRPGHHRNYTTLTDGRHIAMDQQET